MLKLNFMEKSFAGGWCSNCEIHESFLPRKFTTYTVINGVWEYEQQLNLEEALHFTTRAHQPRAA